MFMFVEYVKWSQIATVCDKLMCGNVKFSAARPLKSDSEKLVTKNLDGKGKKSFLFSLESDRKYSLQTSSIVLYSSRRHV